MNILESQVTEINYLAESPIALTGMNGQRQLSDSGSPPVESGKGPTKRKAGEDTTVNAAPHTRAKRNRYISIAWYVEDSLYPESTRQRYGVFICYGRHA